MQELNVPIEKKLIHVGDGASSYKGKDKGSLSKH